MHKPQPQSTTQTIAKTQQVLRKAREKDKAVKVILNKKIDGQREFSGRVSEIYDTDFVLTHYKTGTTRSWFTKMFNVSRRRPKSS